MIPAYALVTTLEVEIILGIVLYIIRHVSVCVFAGAEREYETRANFLLFRHSVIFLRFVLYSRAYVCTKTKRSGIKRLGHELDYDKAVLLNLSKTMHLLRSVSGFVQL